MARQINRRDFVKGSAAAGLGFWIAGRGAWAQGLAPDVVASPNEKLNVAFVGTAGRAGNDLDDTYSSGLANVVALCDIDDKDLGRAAMRFPKAKTYNDFRKMLEQKDIDAVVIGTPDHTHAVAAAASLRLNKHVYCEKPLTHTVHEARVIQELTAKYNRVTQMGTQIHAGSNYRRVVEIIKAGILGQISEVHVWCGKEWGASKTPEAAEPVPSNLHYDLWVGPAPFHEYNHAYLPAEWRRFTAYGDGTLGDMACHFCDLPFWALDLGHPTTISADGPPVAAGCWPHSLTVNYDFPARGALSAVKLTWYDGDRRPAKFAEWPKSARVGNGVMFVGEKGSMFADYGSHHLYPEENFKDFTPPPKTIAESVGHHKEWALACLKNDPSATTCRFAYSGVLTEAVLLGNVAYRSGKTLEWDAKNMRFPNAPQAEQFLHYEYRKGWEL
ncbi:MAG TPA: Gfo/Idh/MocA family oxidoreductase [Tepidisphaeraceae bacterium]|jgi:predicted dehydrogenase|nr:Gfo/Idh/MocA family oxidoreductase [Tepidisphaeraceae bacterium]